MAVESKMSMEVGATMPEFSLPDVVTGKLIPSGSFKEARGFLVVFLCRHCPYVVHVREVLNSLVREYQARGIAAVGISSNDPVTYPDDAPERLAEMVKESALTFPVLFDETQDVARRFDAACTPDFFLFDARRKLFYRGRMDESTPGNKKPCTGAELREAFERLLAGEPPPQNQLPSIGCSIKWRS